MKVLFIGGSADGKCFDLPDDERALSLPVMGEPVTYAPDDTISYTVENYTIHRLRGRHHLFPIGAPCDWDPDQVLTRLLGRYAP